MKVWAVCTIQIMGRCPEHGQWRVITYSDGPGDLLYHPEYPPETWPTKAEADARVAAISARVRREAAK